MEHFFIVILNWNGWHDTEPCIRSILSNEKAGNYTIVLVDNGSKFQEVQKIEEFCNTAFKSVISGSKSSFLDELNEIPDSFYRTISSSRIIFIKNGENLGFANGNNVALKFLEKIGERYVVLLNNDTEIESNALSMLHAFLINNRRCAAVVPQIRFFEPSNVIWNCGGSISFLGVRKYHYANSIIDNVPQSGSRQIDYGTGCVLMLDISQTGLLSDRYFFGEEDFELAYRIKKSKKEIFCLYDSIVFHKVGASRARISEQKMGNMVFHYSQRMSNLKIQLPTIVWYLSVAAHFLSTIRLLRKESFFTLGKVIDMWFDILQNVNNINKYSKEDYIRIANKKY